MAALTAVQHHLPWTDYFEDLQKEMECGPVINALKQYTNSYMIPPSTSRNPRQAKQKWTGEVQEIFMSKGTLIICPPNLIAQWGAEITKHIEDDALHVLTVDDYKKHLPAPQYLAQYDVVLFSRSRFDMEPLLRPMAIHKIPPSRARCMGPMKCSACLSRENWDASPIQNIHWKRLIIDEVSWTDREGMILN